MRRSRSRPPARLMIREKTAVVSREAIRLEKMRFISKMLGLAIPSTLRSRLAEDLSWREIGEASLDNVLSSRAKRRL